MASVSGYNVANFKKAIDEFSQELRWSSEFANLFGAAWLCHYAIVFTPPMPAGGGKGETKDAYDTGLSAVSRDINTIFIASNDPKRRGPATLLSRISNAAKLRDMSAYIKAINDAKTQGIVFDSQVTNKLVRDDDQQRSFKKAQNYFNQSQTVSIPDGKSFVTDLQPIHEKLKYSKRNGRIGIVKNQGDYLGKYLVKTKAEINRYIKLRQAQVGKLKGGWWGAMQSLPKPAKKGGQSSVGGERGISAYFKKFPAAGYSRFTSTPTEVYAMVGNAIGDNGNVASDANTKQLAMWATEKKFYSMLEYQINRDANKFNRS